MGELIRKRDAVKAFNIWLKINRLPEIGEGILHEVPTIDTNGIFENPIVGVYAVTKVVGFICEELANLFGSPCNVMSEGDWCEKHCGQIDDKDCWIEYFLKVWNDRKEMKGADDVLEGDR